MKVLYLSGVEEQELALLRELVADGIEVDAIAPGSKEEAIERAGEFDVVIGARVDRKFLENADRLKFFVIPFAGIPPQDMKVLPDFPHLTIINSHFNARYVAEHAWALLLASVKRICPVNEKHRRGDWTPRYTHQWSGSLAGKTLLIIGYGTIGREVAEIARGFRVTVKALKRTARQAPGADFVGTMEDLPASLPEADFIMVALPGTKHADGALGKKEFELMKEGVHLVNVGRGGVIDEDALYEALKSGKVGGAAIDTWWVYPKDKESRSSTFPSKRPLWEFDNVVFSPHRASHVQGREMQRMRDLAEILNSIAQGKPRNIVDLQMGY